MEETNKASAAGMGLQSGGRKITSEDLELMMMMKESSGVSDLNLDTIYYEDGKNVIRYQLDTKEAYIVVDNEWRFSDEYTSKLSENSQAFPRKYYYKDEYELKKKRVASNGLIGFAVGDAMGVPIEFTSRVSHIKDPLTEMVGYGSHNVPEGTWSDDSSMTIATMDSIIKCNGNIDYDDIMKNYCDWMTKSKYTATDRLFDIGNGTSRALRTYLTGKVDAINCGGKDEFNNGNGSLMRMLPMVYYLYGKDLPEIEKVKIINDYSSLTHGHEVSKLGCKIYYDYMSNILNGKDKKESFSALGKNRYSEYYSPKAISCYKRILDGSLEQANIDSISSSGYVVHTLEACLWTILNTDNYEDAVVTAINMGDDTDTVGAITGSIAGTIYGEKSIPQRWVSKLKKYNYLKELCDKFDDQIFNKKKQHNKYK